MKAMQSQPTEGKTEAEIREARNKGIGILETKGYQFWNTHFSNKWEDEKAIRQTGVKNLPLFFLGHSLIEMSHCDAVYFCKGWEKSNRCLIEHETALYYGLTILYE